MYTQVQNVNGNHTSSFSLRLQIPPAARFARSARAALGDFAKYHKVAALDLESLMFALGEALANAIQRSGSLEDITISFTIDRDSIVAVITDHGRGITELPPAHVPMPEDFAERGRGFAIMQRCTDFFDVTTTPGDGTTVTLGRFRRGHSGTIE